ncbi:hypothetical protein BJ322DRAFT_1023450 [Thelephora terrestris]|uniref:Uncharacterized protein n=1 Tax=Thelephora terrestris TaxID=56493 RepID=A0A9P6L3I0_9AGAM|nr:hypothetical protein BJ322DRAFT_1023450 [Thelephora terrestris]
MSSSLPHHSEPSDHPTFLSAGTESPLGAVKVNGSKVVDVNPGGATPSPLPQTHTPPTSIYSLTTSPSCYVCNTKRWDFVSIKVPRLSPDPVTGLTSNLVVPYPSAEAIDFTKERNTFTGSVTPEVPNSNPIAVFRHLVLRLWNDWATAALTTVTHIVGQTTLLGFTELIEWVKIGQTTSFSGERKAMGCGGFLTFIPTAIVRS